MFGDFELIILISDSVKLLFCDIDNWNSTVNKILSVKMNFMLYTQKIEKDGLNMNYLFFKFLFVRYNY
ncbi:hypothetical protein MASR1M45_17140 [Candidatus Kapaibacterium sp.]